MHSRLFQVVSSLKWIKARGSQVGILRDLIFLLLAAGRRRLRHCVHGDSRRSFSLYILTSIIWVISFVICWCFIIRVMLAFLVFVFCSLQMFVCGHCCVHDHSWDSRSRWILTPLQRFSRLGKRYISLIKWHYSPEYHLLSLASEMTCFSVPSGPYISMSHIWLELHIRFENDIKWKLPIMGMNRGNCHLQVTSKWKCRFTVYSFHKVMLSL